MTKVKPLINSIANFGKRQIPSFARLFDRDKVHLFPDRALLEQVIFPYFLAKNEFGKILFVGCDWYTKYYEKLCRNKEYWTLEIDPNKRKYGSQRHITDSLSNLSQHFSKNYFDLIICNGVFMVTAMDKREIAEKAFQESFQCLRPGGIFILGWNDTTELRPYYPHESANLARFRPYCFPPLATNQYLTDTHLKHTYNFYQKPQS
jgi:SAM-dependent methyltransferase